MNPSRLAFTAGVLGPGLTITYAIALFLGALVVGVVANKFTASFKPGRMTMSSVEAYRSEKAAAATKRVELVDLDALAPPNLVTRLAAATRWGFFDLAISLSVYLTFGFFFAGLVSSLVSTSILTELVGESGLKPLLMTAGLTPVMYTSSYSTVPLLARLISLGLLPGAAIVMLVFGAAANIPAILLILRYFGKKAALVYPLTVGIFSIAAGYVVDLLMTTGIALQNVVNEVIVQSGSC